MKVILINGSPNARGCTYTALSEVAQTLEDEGIETEIIHVGHKDIRGCIGCRKCKTLGKCIFNDIVNEVAPKFKECDGIVIGSPVYFASANGKWATPAPQKESRPLLIERERHWARITSSSGENNKSGRK